jgi:hypothetical protein
MRKRLPRTRATPSKLFGIDNGYALTVGLAIWLGDRVRTLYFSHGQYDLSRHTSSAVELIVSRAGSGMDRIFSASNHDRLLLN